MCAVTRWVECDEFGHMSQSQYALLMEEARATAAAAGAFGTGEISIAAQSSPKRFDMDFVGQAKPGDKLCIYTWWDGESFCCEMERESAEGGKKDILTTSRVWVAHDIRNSKM